MTTSRKGTGSRTTVDPQELREQEVLRANRELAAYFKGRRTEREARAALKIVKAFIRDREHTDPARRRPLPGTAPTPVPKTTRARRPVGAIKGKKRKRPIAPQMPATESSVMPPAPAPAASREDA